jgi:plasmid stabilization system protein ParE
MNARYRLLYLPEAVQELFDIYEMIEAFAGSASARKKLAEIEKVTRSLATVPHVGTVRDEFPSGFVPFPRDKRL